MGQVVGVQLLHVVSDVNPSGTHHLHPCTIRVVQAGHDLDIGGATSPHHEIVDSHTQQLTEPLSANKANNNRSRRLPAHSPESGSTAAHPSRMAWISCGKSNGGRPRRRVPRTRTNEDSPGADRSSR